MREDCLGHRLILSVGHHEHHESGGGIRDRLTAGSATEDSVNLMGIIEPSGNKRESWLCNGGSKAKLPRPWGPARRAPLPRILRIPWCPEGDLNPHGLAACGF